MPGYIKKIKKDLRDIYEFYVDDKKRQEIDSKSWLIRFAQRIFHVFKNVFTKFNPLRKLIFIIALILLLTGNNEDNGNRLSIAAYALLFLLLLELKDKLLVRRELEAGRAVQDALIPRDIPKISGWDIWFYTSPANDVGGDLVDYLHVDKGKYLFVLADIAGKGLGAALLMSKLQATLRAIAAAETDPAQTVYQLNKIFYRDVQKKNFATLVLVELDIKTNQLTYINAGHLPPLKISQANLKEESKGDPAVGLAAESKYHLQSVNLHKGETFLIYSDGVTEARRQDGVFFGDQNLYSLIKQNPATSAIQLGKIIIDRVKTFLGESDQSDDISLLIIKKE